MIVNPQFFNYRLIIGSLIVALAVLTVFSYSNYQSITSHQQFLEQEKRLVESELSQMISQYDEVTLKNEIINTSLQDAKSEAKLALDSLMLLKSDLKVISSFKTQLISLRFKNKTLFNQIDSLETISKQLEADKYEAYKEIEKQKFTNSELVKENKLLSKNLEKGALLTANSFNADAYKSILGKPLKTKKAQNAESIKVCFILAENALTEKGEKDLYIQIVNPKNNVLADKGAINFGDSSLIYSMKKTVDYNNEVIDICVDVKADPNDQPLTEGVYYVNVFYKDRMLGSTQVYLN